ncbi:glycine zipper 2TM domain-containing protein [Massilia arenosa]|uniref:Glycine zipper 2TM domain-containing protein n=1 Tax=Zemynaea arenosa TaxID=2561931 RepID=A0A4Y9SQI8_9BURK|nr:glycine zipper domain-containing protein [Massilia arenosa]TFW28851.1 glycine zipper 2TM domain-containing protein [Massilia arenosa]
MKFAIALTAVLAFSASLSGCVVATTSGSTYRASQTLNEQSVRLATVESVREVTIVNPESGVGTMGGAAIGGIAGSNVGGGKGSAVGAIAGAVAGGLIGQHIENNANKKRGFEITVKLDDGELRAITQEADEMFRPGERVRLLSNGRTTRVTH